MAENNYPGDPPGSVYPILSQPGSGEGHGPGALPPSALDHLNFLQQYDALHVHTNAVPLEQEGHGMCALIRNPHGDFVLNVDKKFHPRTFREYVRGSTLNFISGAGHGAHTDPLVEGKIVFSVRDGQVASVTAGDFALGDVTMDSRVDRSFKILSKTGDPALELKPSQTTTCVGCYCCNGCCIKAYLVYLNGTAIASIEQDKGGTGHEVKFQPQVDVKSRALILAATMIIHEAYFEPQSYWNWHIGYKGRTLVLLYVMIVIAVILIIVISVVSG